jgi:hypothetical protein
VHNPDVPPGDTGLIRVAASINDWQQPGREAGVIVDLAAAKRCKAARQLKREQA